MSRPNENENEEDLDLISLEDLEFPDDELNEDLQPRVSKKEAAPKKWTIITALDYVLNEARGSHLSDEFWDTCKKPLNFLVRKLKLTKIQVVILALMIEEGEPMSWRSMGRALGISRLSMMVYSDEVEDLVKKRWAKRKPVFERGGRFDGFCLVFGVIAELRNNRPYVPEVLEKKNLQEFVDHLESHVGYNMNDNNANYADDEEWMLQLCEANPRLPLCMEALKYKEHIHDFSLFMLAVVDYAQYADSEGEGLTMGLIHHLYPEDFRAEGMRRKLHEGTHILIRHGWLETACDEGGIADTERFKLTRRFKEELLDGYKPSRSQVPMRNRNRQDLKNSGKIREKNMFYNEQEQNQIDRLAQLLSQETLPSIQERLQKKGMHKGFACLFYGGPGTGKTETVLQLARRTGRDIMQVDIASMRDKYVGESEKNIKAVFQRYREACKTSDTLPILFFNEADALINKRTEHIEHSVDKMDNAMQNILLQEIEDLDGILIATTNLTSNLDSAFDRRFLFKVEFHKPGTEVKFHLWKSMLEDISDEDATYLAEHYDFSGGQIENIARQSNIDFVLTGQNATLQQLKSYCDAEQLNKQQAPRNRIGFK